MRDCDDNNRVVLESVEQRVRKVREEASSDTRLDFGRGQWISSYQPHRAIQFVEKLHAFTGASFLKPEVRFIDLLLSECEEPDFHLT